MPARPVGAAALCRAEECVMTDAPSAGRATLDAIAVVAGGCGLRQLDGCLLARTTVVTDASPSSFSVPRWLCPITRSSGLGPSRPNDGDDHTIFTTANYAPPPPPQRPCVRGISYAPSSILPLSASLDNEFLHILHVSCRRRRRRCYGCLATGPEWCADLLGFEDDRPVLYSKCETVAGRPGAVCTGRRAAEEGRKGKSSWSAGRREQGRIDRCCDR